MQTVKCAIAEPANLEELAVWRMVELTETGAEFHAYANIVHKVLRVHEAEHRAARARADALNFLQSAD